MRNIALICAVSISVLWACNGNKQPKQVEKEMKAQDYHTYAQPENAKITHLDLDIETDFENKVISGVASYQIETENAGQIIFDTKNLNIEKVTLNEEKLPTEFSLGESDEKLGTPLIVQLIENTKRVNIHYSTNPGAEALQWLEPQQTADKTQPFLFTQGQAILTRTWIPIQDSPGIRITYHAKVKVPKELLAVMSASNPKEKNDSGIYEFKMAQPIPAYLMALAVGDIKFKEIGERTGVYAEPSVVDTAAYEFADMEKMLEAAEELYGPYLWDRYDVIVLPPSFPFGGMENPRLTFATPTILAGDRSLTSLIAHELAHSWSGNLVTNATWNDFWLNEGFTVYFERRIMEKLYGKDYVEMLWLLGKQDLEAEVEDLGAKNKDTHLHLDLEGRNPDDGMTNIAYEKGAFFLRLLEEKVGREKFDAFLEQYFNEHKFETIATAEFVDYLDTNLIQKHDVDVNVDEWIYQPGIPANIPEVKSDRFKDVELALFSWYKGTPADSLPTGNWTSHEWLHFVRHLPDTLESEDMASLDAAFDFTHTGNSEIAAAWYEKAIEHEYKAAYPEIDKFLIAVGRRKFLTPLYKALIKTDEGKKLALEIYEKARPNYHAVSRNTLDALLEDDRVVGN